MKEKEIKVVEKKQATPKEKKNFCKKYTCYQTAKNI